MEERMQKNSWLRKIRTLAVAVVMTIAGAGSAWGQTTIIPASNRNTVHTRTEVIYVNGSRELYIPELRINDASDAANRDYAWYVHWYGSKGSIAGKDIELEKDVAEDRGGIILGGKYNTDLRSSSDGLWWYEGYGTGNTSAPTGDLSREQSGGAYLHLASCASTITYTAPSDFTGDELICDVSNYRNYSWTEDDFNEPTLLKRYKYTIRPASECAEKLKNGPMEVYNIDYPKGSKKINFSMLSLPTNYFWYEGSVLVSGTKFRYVFVNENGTEQGSYVDFDNTQVQTVDLSSYTEPVTIHVKDVSANSPVLAKYTFNPIENSGFLLESEVTNDRKPENNKELYEEIGDVDFDQNINTAEPLNVDNNIASNPMDPEETTYGFMYKNLPSMRDYVTSAQNQYGLYRSAGHNGISVCYRWGNIYAPWYSFNGINKRYLWIPASSKWDTYGGKQLYDRTHARNSSEYGYFYYIDASDDPGTLVDVEINGTLCGYTELIVTAWLADMTRAGYLNGNLPLAPNINLILKGTNSDGEEVVLHQFTSGDAKTQYNSSNVNQYLMQWQQLCYRITLSTDVENYSNFHLEVQNNEPHTDGADYAIDDVRIYKTLPNIEVYRNNNCDASTLIIGTDYATILRNMGWKADTDVASEGIYDYTNPDYLKYRYGLMGEDHEFLNSTVGNVYFSFWDATTQTWQAVNKAVEKYSNRAAKSLRVAVSTVQRKESTGEGLKGWEFYTEDPDEAQIFEREMNIRALKDYQADWEAVWKIQGGAHANQMTQKVEDIGNPEDPNSFNEQLYQEALIELFGERLDIPRLRCPWYDKAGYLHLAIIDVNNTDLKYVGQDGASGEYKVVTFSAARVAEYGDNPNYTIDAEAECTLSSSFLVRPATTVLIDANANKDENVRVCLETLHEIKAFLTFYKHGETAPIDPEKDNVIKDLSYVFDWFLGPMGTTEEVGSYAWYTAQNGFSIKQALNAYREYSENSLQTIYPEGIKEWQDDTSASPVIIGNEDKRDEMATLLLNLIAENKLLLGTLANKEFNAPINTERMVAMPYLPTVTIEATKEKYDFCYAETEVNLRTAESDNPEIYHGFLNVDYGNSQVALRLGRPNMTNEGKTLDLPIYKIGNWAKGEADHLGLEFAGDETSVPIMLDGFGYPIVGEAISLNIPIDQADENGKLSAVSKLKFRLYEAAKDVMYEGQEYNLLIPFAQYTKEGQVLDEECKGMLRLPVKVVPEYLTWQGGVDDKWYADDNWNQSTKKELYSGTTDTDYNGSDVITDAYSPLYFTNITILGNTDKAKSELQLENEGEVDENGKSLSLDDTYLTSTGENEYPIKYDLAVNTDDKDNWIITPYYINKVNQIYFKPEATLLNQHRLTYNKAWVEFEMTPGDDYWMASPLKEVYAGDMYAPTVGGQQNTEAFTPIKYDNDKDKNNRWNPAFYQKAWNKDIQYAASDANKDGVPDDSEITSVEVVPSNWSIEYNDATVSYAIGKGFYSRVEMTGATDNTVKVRLPKADNDYKYEYSPTTRALHDITDKTEQPNLADLDADGSMSLDLSTVDNDGNHFLVGNPYMAYLNMSEFLKANSSVLAEKYWTIDNEKVIVGTPDVVGTTGKWPDAQTTGYIAPMQAFFVESKDYDPGITKADGEITEAKKVTFKASMTVAATTATADGDTKSFSAVNPILTLTATSKQGQSRAAVVQKSDASNQYEADKDAVALLDSELDAPMAYTVAGSYAAAVNAIHDYKNVPLGVYAKDGEEVELSIEGASQLVSPLYLYDAVTRSTTPIDGDSFTLNLTGSSHGRYFLTTDEGIKAEGDIRIYSPADGQLIIASTPSDRLKQVQVYDLNGRMVESRQNVGTATCQLYVPGGIYIVRVQSEQGEAQAKLKIK